MFSKRRTDAASPKAAQKVGQKVPPRGSTVSSGLSKPDPKAAKELARAAKAAEQAAADRVKAAKKAAKARKAAAKPARQTKVVTFGAGTDTVTVGKKADVPAYRPGEKPSFFNLAEWSLRRKVALVLAVPVLLAGAFGGLRVRTEMAEADNYAATASQVTVLDEAVDYLEAAQRAAVVARAVGINDPKLTEAQQEVVEAGAALVDARDRADLTPVQLRQVNTVMSLSEQMRTGMAYVSLTSSVSQVRQLERGLNQLITNIIDEQIDPEPALLVLAQALDGRLSLSLQEVQVANSKTIPANPVELYSEFGVELGAIDRLAISLGQTDQRVLAIRQANAQRVVSARGGNTKVSAESYEAYDVLIDDLLTTIDDNLATAARNAKILTYVDSGIIGSALLAAIILALMVSRLLLNPIRRVRSGALEVAHERLPEAVRKIRSGEEPGEIVPIGVTTHEETGQLARAVDDLHRQAVKLASGEAALRAQVGDMFVTLSRRNTSLINQQLGLIETLESDEEDPQRLESLFRLDHLAARMRRNAESLVILSGAPTRATDQDDLSLTDVLQAAIAGVQDYRRVQLDAAPAQRVNGEAAADVVHMLSELVDNALSYSPPSSRVLVTSSFTRGGVIVQVTDGGLGIADDALAELNEKLRSGGEVTADTARRMGLFVVSRLAQRHGLSVSLDQNDRMGVTATVYLPTSVLSDTARLEAGSTGGAQVIELGAAPARDVEEDEVAEIYSFREPEPEPVDDEIDPITAAINAYGLPQRRPGATGAGHASTPEPMGGGFFDRVEPDDDEAADVPEAAEVPVMFVGDAADYDVVDAVLAQDDSEVDTEDETDAPALTVVSDDAHEEDRAAIALGPVTDDGTDEDLSEDAEESAEADSDEQVAETDSDDADDSAQDEDELAPVLATLPLRETVPFEVSDPDVSANGNGNGNSDVNGRGNAFAGLMRRNGFSTPDTNAADTVPDHTHDDTHDDVQVETHADTHAEEPGPLDRPATPASMQDDETPIFLSLRSNWLSADSGERPWADSEVDAGWDAADRIEATPPTRRTETGLPMRRPGNRLIPGGLSTQTAHTVRDPEAIRARLAAHAAGVSRGRTKASEVLTEPTTQEVDPA